MATDTPIVDDLDFWLRTLSAGYDVRMISDRLGVYRIEAGSVSRPVDPMRSEVFEEQRERALSRAALRSGDPAAIAALERVLRRLRYQQAIRRARVAIQKGSVEEARQQCRRAFAQRRTLRAGAILVMLRVAPSALVRIHPVKQRVQERLQRRLRQLRRTSLRQTPGRSDMNVLVLTSRPIVSRHIGYDLRVANLCAHTPGALHLVIAPLGQPDGVEQTLSIDGLFDSVDVLDPLLGKPQAAADDTCG